MKIKPNPLGMALKQAFRAYCADMGTMNPAYRAREMYCPFCGEACRLSTPRVRKTYDTEAGVTEHILEEEVVTPPDELCHNGCMKLPPQVTLHAGDAVDGGIIATFNADGTPQVKV